MSTMNTNISDCKLFVALLAATLIFQMGFAQDLAPTLDSALLNVVVVSEAGNPPVGDTIWFVPVGSKEGYYGVTDDSGKFSLLIPNDRTYEARFKNSQGQNNRPGGKI